MTVERPSLAFRRLGKLVLLAHANIPPAPDDWERYLEQLGPLLADPALGILVLTDDVGPTAAQRESMNRALARANVSSARTAVVSMGKLTRGIVTILSWFNSGIRAFQPAQLDDALTYVGVDESRRAAVLAEIAELRLLVAGVPADARARGSIDPYVAVATPLEGLLAKAERELGVTAADVES